MAKKKKNLGNPRYGPVRNRVTLEFDVDSERRIPAERVRDESFRLVQAIWDGLIEFGIEYVHLEPDSNFKVKVSSRKQKVD